MSGIPLRGTSRQLASSLTQRMPMKQTVIMASSGTCTGLASEAHRLLFSRRNISRIPEFESEAGPHSYELSQEGVPTDGGMTVACFGLTTYELPPSVAQDIFVDGLAICFCGRSLDTLKRYVQHGVYAISERSTGNGLTFVPQSHVSLQGSKTSSDPDFRHIPARRVNKQTKNSASAPSISFT